MILEDINTKIKTCTKCNLSKTRTQAVPGAGCSRAKILFIGEAPGKNEDLEGKPFVGRAGKLLDTMLQEINLEREDVYITNTVKCRPPGNRDPLPGEIKACLPWLKLQLKIIKPQVIVLLGRHSLNRFLPKEQISQAHGKVFKKYVYTGKTDKIATILFPIYHPAAALYNPNLKEVLQNDFKTLAKIIKS